MIRSTNKDLGEYELIRAPDHITKVWSAIESALPHYWDKFVSSEVKKDPAQQLAQRFRTEDTRSSNSAVARAFAEAITDYEKEAKKYRSFFTADMLDEFRQDPNAFKQSLARDVPVIANTLRQINAPELREWQMHFRKARGKDLLELFSNVLDFQADWSAAHPPDKYAALNDQKGFELDPLDADGDPTMNMVNVVGMGIKSIILYHLDPKRMPLRARNDLYGLYFLSGRGDFALPSKSSEFLMINDVSPVTGGSFIMDQNFWYPYGLFSLYALRIYRWICGHADKLGVTFDSSVRFVYVDCFFESICKQHSADLKTMRAQDRFEIPE